MTQAADIVFTNAAVHPLTDPESDGEPAAEAVAVRDGEIVRVDSDYEIDFLTDAETEVVDLDGRHLLPGFIDAHTHMESVGSRLVHANLAEAESRDEALSMLATDDDGDGEWTLGVGYDESNWDDSRLLRADDLDAVSESEPVAAVRVDGHTAAVNTVALDRLADEFPGGDVLTEDAGPTGVIVEDAVGVVREATAPGVDGTRDLIRAARDRAHELGVTGVHDMVRHSHAPRVYRELDGSGELNLRVRINYWRHHFDAVVETGLRTNHGSEFVEVGGIKSFTDGAIGGRTAKVTEPYDDGDGRGQWVVDPDPFREIVADADDEGYQITVHAIGDEAIEVTLSAFEETATPGESRHRIEHVELATDEHVERLAESGVIASMQPNFHQWADEGGLYENRLGEERTRWTNRLRTMQDAGVHLAFGSDCMPMDPLYGIDWAVNAPAPEQRLTVTEALRAYTIGAAYAGFDEDRLGTVEVGKKADFVVLDDSPWERSDAIDDIDVALTVVDGEVVYDER